MSDSNLTQLPQLANLSTGDLIYFVRPPSGSNGDFATNYGNLVSPSGILYTDASGNKYQLSNFLSDFPTSVKSFGASGDDIHDDTVALRNAFQSNQGHIFLPNGIYKISGDITGSHVGQIIEGHSVNTTIKQYLSGGKGISFRTGPDAIYPDGAGLYSCQLRNLSLQSVNISAGKGIDIGSTAADSHDGDYFSFDNIRVNNFDTGVHIKGMAQVTSSSLSIQCASPHSGTYGILIEGGSINSHEWKGVSIVRCKTGVYYNCGGIGNRFNTTDFGSNDVNIALGNGAGIICIGGNMDSTNHTHLVSEGSTDTVLIGIGAASQPSSPMILQNSRAVIIDGRFLMSGDAASSVFLSPDSVINVSGSTWPGEGWHGLPFLSCYDNGLPTSSAFNRGTIYHQIGRSGVAADAIVLMNRKSDGLTYFNDTLNNGALLAAANTWANTQTISPNFGLILGGNDGGAAGSVANGIHWTYQPGGGGDAQASRSWNLKAHGDYGAGEFSLRFSSVAQSDACDTQFFYFDSNASNPTSHWYGDILADTAGRTLKIKGGANAKAGTFTITGGGVLVNNTSVTANSVVIPTLKTISGTIGGGLYVNAISAGASFTVTGGGASNSSTYNYTILEVN